MSRRTDDTAQKTERRLNATPRKYLTIDDLPPGIRGWVDVLGIGLVQVVRDNNNTEAHKQIVSALVKTWEGGRLYAIDS